MERKQFQQLIEELRVSSEEAGQNLERLQQRLAEIQKQVAVLQKQLAQNGIVPPAPPNDPLS